MTTTLSNNGQEAVITLSGNLTVENADPMTSMLIKAIIDHDLVVLVFGVLSKVDLSFLQLLCSAHRSAVRMNKRVVFKDTWPELFRKCVEDAGYVRMAGCRLDPDKSCLWAKGQN